MLEREINPGVADPWGADDPTGDGSRWAWEHE